MTIEQTQAVDLALLRAQDHGAFTQLVQQYHGQLLVVARAIVRPAQAEEVVQEAWVSIFRALPKFEGRSSIKTWMFTIVSNAAKGKLRKENREITWDDAERVLGDYLSEDRFKSDGHWSSGPVNWHMESPDRILEESQLKQCIEKNLALLPDAQRAVFLLRDVEQQPLDTICNMLGITNSNARVLLHRARVSLLSVVDHYQETGQC
ncbi:RNA polymerase sigma factor [Simiduia aestuariiviva]|uniref:RNA polymerase sigma-70 factor (ECF subfamily) n=1 Tax=Simiduia aestuariiviva TaxID=1510459 RepID=A0A839UWB2_9GAMM|nr:sigma-70 family RNA polymerase sigma factor [Simiduia aestuariiviva]MBB3169615.1 RNA polymerase sigma-70 factor (ECF subfamily) [Simiduia aestuariiviva]